MHKFYSNWSTSLTQIDPEALLEKKTTTFPKIDPQVLLKLTLKRYSK